ncbi:histidine ammonia-lyase [Candidatus Bipolaricaulota bacterium]|nr:histidine ammonia-lyase [Candidatus Bipolaricaulota bacterium]
MIELDGHSLTLEQATRVVFENEEVAASDAARDRVERAQGIVEKIVAKGRPVYGINTGFGRLSNESIPRDRLQELQRKIILSHAVGVGKRIPAEAVRAILLFRSNSLLKGNSGIRFQTIQYLIDLLNHRVHPSIPEQGSVGSSGDLAPLAHLALVLLGKGEAEYDGKIITGDEALSLIDRPPLSLAPKEGLALLNGTQFMAGLSFLVYARGKNLLKNALAAAALSLEGLRAFTAPFDERLHQSRPHPGQIEAARAIRILLKGSTLVDSTVDDVQDAYSLRCIPQVLGPAFEALAFLKEKVTIEINAATDNPLIFTDGAVLSGGNFHGEILGLALEMVAMALSEVGSIAERRIDKLLTSPHRGLPLFLVEERGINSGLMLIQYTAASLVSENKVLCHPALVDSIPTSGGKEDHNSLAPISARKALRILTNLERIIAIELLCAAQAIDLQKGGHPGEKAHTLHERIRTIVPRLEEDRYLAPEIERLTRAVATGGLVHGLL